jgi:LAO/AO transport system kinase
LDARDAGDRGDQRNGSVSRQGLAQLRAGDRRALARAITLVENGDPLAYELVRDVYPRPGRAYASASPGPPGVGKSTLIGALVRTSARGARRSACSRSTRRAPFTQGALLGDRIRLTDHFLDPGVFIRSMGTRGHARRPRRGDAAGAARARRRRQGRRLPRDGRRRPGEVDMIDHADTVVLVLMPGSGDSIQALKAGIMEIPDVIAINKMDHPRRRRC